MRARHPLVPVGTKGAAPVPVDGFTVAWTLRANGPDARDASGFDATRRGDGAKMPRAQGTPRMIRVSGPSAEFSFSRGERKSIRSRIPTVAPPTLVPFLLHRFVCTPARAAGRLAWWGKRTGFSRESRDVSWRRKKRFPLLCGVL